MRPGRAPSRAPGRGRRNLGRGRLAAVSLRGAARRGVHLAALALGAVTLAALAGSGGSVGAAPAGPEPSGQPVTRTAGAAASAANDRARPGGAAQTAPTGSTQIELVDQTTWLDDNQPFRARVRITRPPEGAQVRYMVYERLLSRAQFQGSLDGDVGATEIEGSPVPIAMLPSQSPGTRDIDFPTDGLVPGNVYPVEVQVLDENGTPVAGLVTHLVVRPSGLAGFRPLSVGIVLDIATPPVLQPDGTMRVSDDALARVRDRVEVLQQSPDAPLTIAPRPETLDALAALDGRGPDLVTALRDARGARPVLARPYTAVDVAALMDAGAIAELNAQAEGGANVVRSLLGTEPVPGIWLSGATLGDGASRMLTDLGIGYAVLPADAVEDVPGVEPGRVPEGTFRLGDGGPVSMVSDPALQMRLTSRGGVLGAEHFAAELAILWLEAPANERGVVVHVPPGPELDTALLRTALAELGKSQILAPMTLDRLFAQVPPVGGQAEPTATPAQHQPTDDLSAVAQRVEAARAQIDGYSGTVGDAEMGRSLADSLLLATGADTPPGRRGPYVDRFYEELQGLQDVIRAPAEFRITLTSRTSEIPLNLTNDSNQPVTVRVLLESDQLEFPGGSEMTETLQPGGNRIPIPVRTRASGAFPLNITVTSPDGSVVFERTRFDIRSTVVSGVGLVLSIGAGLFLAIWWARHWRTARRARRLLAPEDIPAAAPPGTPARGIPALGDGRSPRNGRRRAGDPPDRSSAPDPPTPPGPAGSARPTGPGGPAGAAGSPGAGTG